MRIVFIDYVCNPARPGTSGLSDLVWDMASRLARMGEEVHVIAPYTVSAMPDDAVHVHRFSLPPLGYRNIAGHMLIIKRACQYLLRLGNVDIVHVPEYLSAGVLVTMLRGRIPVVLTEPGNIYQRVKFGNPYDWTMTVALKIAARRSAYGCARLIATSVEIGQWWRATGFSADRVNYIPLGIDTSLFHRVPDAKSQVGFSPDRPAIVYAARLSRENGIDVALTGVAQSLKSLGPVDLHVLGDGPERASLVELSRRLGIQERVFWHGWVDLSLLPAYYSAADAFVFAGRSGGTPRVMIQAMACGAPIIASSIGGIVDHVQHGHTGLLFPSGDSAGLARELCAVLRDQTLAQQLGEQAERYARAAVDWDILVHRVRNEVYGPLATAAPLARGSTAGVWDTGHASPLVERASGHATWPARLQTEAT